MIGVPFGTDYVVWWISFAFCYLELLFIRHIKTNIGVKQYSIVGMDLVIFFLLAGIRGSGFRLKTNYTYSLCKPAKAYGHANFLPLKQLNPALL